VLSPGGTQYAPGFDEASFDRVTVGMPEQEVLSLRGPPLDQAPWHTAMGQKFHVARYARSVSSGKHWRRSVFYAWNSTVASKSAGYFVDQADTAPVGHPKSFSDVLRRFRA